MEPDLKPSVHDAVVSALEEIGRMSNIVESLLAIARLDAGPDAITARPADLGALCSWVVEQMHPLAEDKGIEIRVQSASLTALVDTARMKQVLVNVIDNAIKYTPPGGSIALTAFTSDGMAVIEVMDTGIGIPAADLLHVFDRFFRADTARSRGLGGAGLGLSIVKAICNAHGGSIGLQSSEGIGTAVRIRLPLAMAGLDSTAVVATSNV